MNPKSSLLIFFIVGLICFLTINSFIIRENKVFSTETKRFSGAMAALDFWANQRAYPNDVIPDDAYFKAFENAKEHVLNKSENVQTSYWLPIGPHNIGGRTLSIAFNPLNPNTVYAGSASGGLWRSYTGGVGALAWEYVPTGFPVLSVSSIVFHPADSNTIYIATGEVYAYQNSTGGLSIRTTRGSYGIGILKTTNAGVTWSKSLDWSYNQKRGVQVVKINQSNPNILFAGTSEGIFRTTNAGLSWNQVHNVVMTTDLIINPQNTEIILASCGNLNSAGGGIYLSTNGGSTWSKSVTGLPASFGGKIHLADFEATPTTVYASIGKGSSSGAGTQLCKSTDNGITWSTISSTDYATYQGWYSHFVIPHRNDAQKILCGGIDMWKSINGGVSLTQKSYWNKWFFGVVPPGGPEGPTDYSHADHHSFAVHPTNPDIVYLATDGGIFRSLDFGETFEGCNGGYQTTQFYKRFSASRQDTLSAIGGMQDNATAMWEGTVAWRRAIGGDGCCTQISPTNADTMYGSSQYLNILRSSNKGLNWTSIAPPSNNEAFNGSFLIAPSNSKIIYAAGDKIYRSINAGTSWTAVNNNAVINGDPILSIAISYSNPDSVFVTTAPNLRRAEIFRSINGGASWVNVTSTLPDRYPVDISVDPNNSSTVYVAFSGFGTSHLYKSINGGSSWINSGNGLPDVPTSAVVVDPKYSSIVYVGNDLGVYISKDSGNTWNDFNNGLEDALLTLDLAVSPANRMLYAASHGRGVYRIKLEEPGPVKVENENAAAVQGFELYQNYPNPFNPTTTIRFMLTKIQVVTIKIFDNLGREIVEIINKEMPAGAHQIYFDASLYSLPTGIYFYRVESDKLSQTRKMVYLK